MLSGLYPKWASRHVVLVYCFSVRAFMNPNRGSTRFPIGNENRMMDWYSAEKSHPGDLKVPHKDEKRLLPLYGGAVSLREWK